MQHIIDFVLELDRLKSVLRRTRPAGLDRFENSAEHSWQIALLAASLEPYAEEPVDIDRVVPMLLVHDVGEIDAGDLYIYAEGGWEEREAAERASVTRIFSLLPEPQRSHFIGLWEEFEAGQTPEARFARAADRAMPVILNLANRGQSWKENGITYERLLDRVAPAIERGCPRLWAHLKTRLDAAERDGWFGAP